MGDNFSRGSVLIVDDDGDVRDALTELLTSEGFTVLTAENGAVAVTKLGSGFRPGIILLDLMMPVMNGWQVWDWLQEHSELSDIPVVIVTASGMRSFGATPVLEKPVAPSTLLSMLASLT